MFKSTILIITLLLVIATKPSAGALDQFLSAFKSVNRMVRNEPVQTSNVVFCNQARLNDKNTDHVVRKYCTGPSFNFSFSAYFHNKDLLKLKNLKRLAQTFSQYSVCEANFMRYNFEAQRLQYFNAGETYLLNEGKILNETSNPQVHIIKDTLQKDKRKIIFECKLPLSDVFLSLNQNEISARKSIHSHPLPMNRATVSGIHVKLNFLQMENLVVNVNTRRLNSEGDMLNQARDQLLNSKKPIERFLVHYDTKCRQCELNGVNFTTPLANDSIRCNLKVKYISGKLLLSDNNANLAWYRNKNYLLRFILKNYCLHRSTNTV